MFNRYWRTYPWLLQMVLLMLMVITLVSFATFISLLVVPKVTGLAYPDLIAIKPGSPLRNIRANLILQGFAHAGMFLFPAALFAAVTHPKAAQYLGLRLPGKPLHWLLATGIIIGLLPVFQWGEAWSHAHLYFGSKAEELQAANNNTIAAYLRLGTPQDFALLLAILALLPALGEEFLFRGVLLRILHRRISKTLPVLTERAKAIAPDVQRSMVFPVVMTALLFAAIHFNFHGFLFIFIAGCVLALIYFLTGSLLCSIWAHLLYNGTQVAAEYFAHSNKAVASVVHAEVVDPIYAMAGLLLFGVCFYLLVKHQTPMAQDWSDDFRDEKPAIAE